MATESSAYNHVISPHHIEYMQRPCIQGGLQNFLHTIATIAPSIAIVTTDLHVKIIQVCRFREWLICIQQHSINRHSSPARRGTWSGRTSTPISFYWNFSSSITSYLPVIPVNWCIMVNLHPPRGFSHIEFSHKNILSPSIFWVVLIIERLYTKYSRLWCGLTVRLFAAENLHHSFKGRIYLPWKQEISASMVVLKVFTCNIITNFVVRCILDLFKNVEWQLRARVKNFYLLT